MLSHSGLRYSQVTCWTNWYYLTPPLLMRNAPFYTLPLSHFSRYFKCKVAHSRCASMYGKCRLLSVDRYNPQVASLIIERRGTIYADSKETTFSVDWSASRVSNLIIQPWRMTILNEYCYSRIKPI